MSKTILLCTFRDFVLHFPNEFSNSDTWIKLPPDKNYSTKKPFTFPQLLEELENFEDWSTLGWSIYWKESKTQKSITFLNLEVTCFFTSNNFCALLTRSGGVCYFCCVVLGISSTIPINQKPIYHHPHRNTKEHRSTQQKNTTKNSRHNWRPKYTN